MGLSTKGIPLWQEFIMGTKPDDETSKFTANIAFDADGKPVVTWTPALNGVDENGECVKNGIRTYRLMGSSDLENWTTVADGAEGLYNFFKVAVDMP